MEDLNNKKLLIIRLSALGDVIHTLPLAYALKKQFPNLQMDWVVEDKACKFIQNNPLINKVYVLPKNQWKKNNNKFQNIIEYLGIINQIRKEKYDIVLDTQQLLKSGIILGLSGGKRKITLDDGREFSFIFANEIIKTGKKQFDLYYHVVKRNLEFAKYLGCNDLEPKFVLPDLENGCSEGIRHTIENLDKSKKTIVIAPATTWVNKHWHTKGWVDVINEFRSEYNIILTAGEKEKRLINEIKGFIVGGNIIDLSGKTTIEDLIYIFKNTDVLVSPDSGSAHIAWASGKCSIITLFFATSSSRTAPFGEKYYSCSSEFQCSPCMKKKCVLKEDVNSCVYSINSDKVIQILKKVLQ